MTHNNEHPLERCKEQMLEVLGGLFESEFDFEEEAAVFTWRYQEHPDIFFQLAIGKMDEEDMQEFQDTVRDAVDTSKLH